MVLEAAFLSKTRSPSYDKRMVGFEAAPSKTLKIDLAVGRIYGFFFSMCW